MRCLRDLLNEACLQRHPNKDTASIKYRQRHISARECACTGWHSPSAIPAAHDLNPKPQTPSTLNPILRGCLQVMRLVKVAGVKVAELSEKLRAALAAHESARVAARVRRKEPQKLTAPASRSVTVLSSADITGARWAAPGLPITL